MTACHLRLVVDTPSAPARGPTRFAAWAPFPIAGLVAIGAVLAHDWIGLGVAAVLAAAGALAYGGSRPARLVAGGVLLYVARAAAFDAAGGAGPLAFIAGAALGASAFALLDLVAWTREDRVWSWYEHDAPLQLAAGALLAAVPALVVLWLIGPSAVHLLDLSLVLPAMVMAGAALLRGRQLGRVFAPILLPCAALMALAGVVGGELLPAIACGIVALFCIAVELALLVRVRA